MEAPEVRAYAQWEDAAILRSVGDGGGRKVGVWGPLGVLLGRTAEAVRKRWNKLQSRWLSTTTTAAMKNSAWTEDEVSP
jgi:hypothetical protein